MSAAFVLFFSGNATSTIESRLDVVRLAVSEHVLRLAAKAGFSPVLAVTTDAAARASFAPIAEVVPPRTSPFHLGRELREIVRARKLERLCVTGAGFGALLRVADLRGVREKIEGTDSALVANNYYSGDLVAFTPATALDAIELPAADNPLPRLLHQQAGLPSVELPRGAVWLFDVDTPTDATILVRDTRCPPTVKRVGAWENELGSRIDAILGLLATPEVEVCVAGRVGAPVWSFLETQTACRVRVLSEERGMQAAGRDASGEARTVLGFLYDDLGPERFFARMAELGSGLILDSRVLFAHLGLRPSAEERFASDVFDVAAIRDERLAAFTRAAEHAPMPVLLGGHSIVSGALFAMSEIAWQSR
jgi:CTP:molybdopterin cytidylyltransferase MocA